MFAYGSDCELDHFPRSVTIGKTMRVGKTRRVASCRWSSRTWIEVAEAQKVTPPWVKEIKDVLARANVNDIVAARDR